MSLVDNASELFQGFSKLTREERFQRLFALGALTPEDAAYLNTGGIQTTELAEHLIENVIGYFQLPLGVATNVCIDSKDYVIPMAVEETSIVAALSKTAKWIKQNGSISTHVTGECILGQIQFANVKNVQLFTEIFEKNKFFLIEQANQDVASSMVQRGGGVVDLTLRQLPRNDGGNMIVLHLTMNSCDAMGANMMNQVLEYLKSPLEQLTGEIVNMCILSNLNDQKLTTAIIRLNNVEPRLGSRLHEASLFAETDPYRAATNNKGVMNGIDPVLIATGNDWRAVEAGVHAYAARRGTYQSITRWSYKDKMLTGELTAPIIVGTVGGVTSLHPTAGLCLKMMGIQSANHLSRVIAAVGLIQNLGAITALCTEGIIQGHMKLHVDNLILATDATRQERPVLKKLLQHWLSLHQRVSLKNEYDLLADLRKKHFAT